jgi:ComF family protein
VRALGPYNPPYSSLVHALKYDQKTRLVPLLGLALTGLVESDPDLKGADCVCAVPLHRSRLRERGYNQSGLLAWEVSKGAGIELVDAVDRVRNTRSQVGLADDAARKANMRGAFRVKPGINLDGRRVLLVDDVMTSGATLDAASRQLLKAGASSVLGLVVAAA